MSRSVNWHYFLTSGDFYSIPLADDLVQRTKMSWWNGQRKRREKTENILAGCIKLSYTTSTMPADKKKASGITDVIYWQAQKHLWQAKELRISNLWMKHCMHVCVYIYIQWEVIDTQENMLDRLNLSNLNYTYFPSPLSVLKLHIRFTFSLASQDIPSASYDINHTAWSLSMQGNSAKGDSDQIFYSQINSPCSLAAPFSLPASKLW